MDSFKAFRIDESGDGIAAGFADLTLDDLSPGEVVVRVTHSTINYKDALAATGTAKILRRYPLVAGIDLAGEIVIADDPDLTEGTPVLVNGCGLGETRDGGYAEYARVPADAVVEIPDGMTPKEAMQIGTAGFTAALAIHRMEQNGQVPGVGPIVVTGAIGSDTGGSIRFPSASCGLVGIKPTYGRVSRHGGFPLAASLDHFGPMARCTEDAARLLTVIAGVDAADPSSLDEPVPNFAARADTPLRLGVDWHYAEHGVSSTVTENVRGVVKNLQRLGVDIKGDHNPFEGLPSSQQLTERGE